ncbi:MAG TPA: CHAT domain-containing protein [Blastocatellia bacterium]|nr:CHAT domain-containing protein [Blastocatellia bacterium]
MDASTPLFLVRRSSRPVHRGAIIVASLLSLAGALTTASARMAAGGSSRAQDEQCAVPEPGRSIKRELGGGQAHSYRIMLDTGQFFRAVVDQQGVNLLLTLYGPDGRKICDLDSPVGAQGAEPVSLVAETSGGYRLEVRAWQPNAPRGRYELKVQELRTATPEDKARVVAERAFAEATIVGGQMTAESLRNAIEKYREVTLLWHTLGDRQQEAYTLTAIGYCHGNLGEYEQALDYYDRALLLRQATGDRGGEALALYNIGAVYGNSGKPQQALDSYQQALSINRAIGNQSMEAATLGNMGVIYSDLGEQQKALEFFNQSLLLKRAVGDPYGEATLLNNIGLVHCHLGEHQKALEFYHQALPVYRAINYRSGEATTLNNIGTLYSELGEYRKALEFLEEVLQIKRAAGNRVEEATTLNNIGVAWACLGERQKSLDYYRQALPLSRAAGARSLEATTLNNIGKTYDDSGDHRQALDYYDQTLSLRREIGDRRGEAVALTNVGRAYHGLGEYERALGFYDQALRLQQAMSDRSSEAVTRYNIARTRRGLNHLAEARAQIEAALAIVESLRTGIASQGLRTSYLASIQSYYGLGIDLLMRLHRERPADGFAAAALQMSERARARGLLELLAENRADIRQGVSPELLERERALQQSLDAKATAQTRLLGVKHTAEQAAAAAREIEALAAEYEQVQAQIRQTSPRYAALTQPVPLNLKEIRAGALDPDTLLLEYALGEEKSYLWAVTPTSVESFELPKRAEIETVARRVCELLSARNQHIPNETPERRRQRLEQADAEYPKVAATLSRMLLGQVAAGLGNKRLLIVSDGLLQYVPFAALPAPAADSRPLVADHEVVSLPSASVVAALRQETAGRKPASRTLAVLADPVFSSDDPRVARSGESLAAAVEVASLPADAKRSAGESGLADLVRLRFSRQEADEITRLVADKLEALDFAASRALAVGAELGQYRIVHFATHGLINNLHPGLSGIVLSLVDEQGRPQNGFLRLYEIYNLRLGADLVVLSACQTALGKEFRGEGLVGLVRGFMYAGAPRVVASLWRVDDRATAEVMKRFYEGMLGQGLRPAAALRAAQISMWKDRRWQSPDNWAAFTLQGEWK